MVADARQVMRILDHRDIDVRLHNGQLIARSRDVSRAGFYIDPQTGEWCRGPAENGLVPDDMIQFIRRFKDLIIVELTKREREHAA